MWEAAYEHLKGKDPVLVNQEIAEWLRYMIDGLLSNRPPVEVTALKRKGAVSTSSTLKDATMSAILWRQAVGAGDIEQRDPMQFLVRQYDAKETTIQGWIRKAPVDAWLKFRPTLPLEQRIKALKLRMKWDVKAYKELSPSSQSIIDRAKKGAAK